MHSKSIKVKLYMDPGHGWALVTRDQLVNLGIIDQITSYSYQRGGNVYLEEDHDLSIFCKALRDRNVNVTFNELHTNRRSKIRSYDHFRI